MTKFQATKSKNVFLNSLNFLIAIDFNWYFQSAWHIEIFTFYNLKKEKKNICI